MFGFIRPVKPELRVREVERFQCVYCGLCHAIRQEYGRLHTLFLSYDMTFLALVLTSLEETAPEVVRRRCDASPVRPKAVCTAGEGIRRAADLGVLLTYHKTCDTLLDEHGAKRLAARGLRVLLHRGYQKARQRLPEEDAVMAACLDELHALEEAHTPSLDRPADTFARLLAAMVPPSADDTTARILRQMFYHTGRWVYLIDACADLEDDLKKNAYNPVALRFGLTEASLAPVREDMEITLQRSLADIYNAFELLTVQRDRELIENIICLGMPVVTRQVLDGTYQSNGGQSRHGSL
ncbi:MAG: DUF5685 family protein [Butyricicoccus sp.]